MTDFQQNFSGMPGQQLMPQGLFGGLLGGPLGGWIGKGVGSLVGNPGMGAQIGQLAGGIGGSLLPFNIDPVAAAYAQQQQLQQLLHLQQLQQMQQPQLLAPQGLVGNLIGQFGQPVGSAIGGAFGNQQLGSTLGGLAGQFGRLLPFNVDPVSAAYAQQAQLAPQGIFSNLIGRPLSGMISPTIGSLPIGIPILGHPFGGQIQNMLPFHAQQAAMGQQAQLAPQGFLGDLIGQVGQPLGGAIGGAFGNAGLGNTIGGIAGQLGRLLPFGADPMMQAYAQQQQLAPQGFFGNILGQIGQPIGNALGGMLGNAGLGGAIGNAAGQLGRLLPFGADAYPGFQNQQFGGFAGQPTLH